MPTVSISKSFDIVKDKLDYKLFLWSKQKGITPIENPNSSRSQFVTLKTGRGSNIKYLPYAFTEQGVAMLSGILNSDKAIAMNIAIMQAFVDIRKILVQENNLQEQLKQIKERIGEHDIQLNQLYDALENLLDENAGKRKWEERERIGFTIKE